MPPMPEAPSALLYYDHPPQQQPGWPRCKHPGLSGVVWRLRDYLLIYILGLCSSFVPSLLPCLHFLCQDCPLLQFDAYPLSFADMKRHLCVRRSQTTETVCQTARVSIHLTLSTQLSLNYWRALMQQSAPSQSGASVLNRSQCLLTPKQICPIKHTTVWSRTASVALTCGKR